MVFGIEVDLQEIESCMIKNQGNGEGVHLENFSTHEPASSTANRRKRGLGCLGNVFALIVTADNS